MRTSKTDPLQIAEVETPPGCAVVGVTFCPGKKDPTSKSGPWDRDLDIDLDAIEAWGAVAVVTLIEDHEFELLKVPALSAGVARRHMDWLHLPIRDVDIPTAAFESRWQVVGPELRARLRDGAKIVVHCRGGLGRAGTIAARLLIDLGVAPETAVDRVRAVRPKAIETIPQEEYVLRQKPLPDPKPSNSRKSIEDRAVGALLGLAVGDALGTTLEFKARDDRAEILTDIVGGGPFRLKAGQWTDDTAMALALAHSLEADGTLDQIDLMTRFVAWWKAGEYSCTGDCFDIGGTTSAALQRWLETGNPCAGSTDPNTGGNGSLMRLSPAAIRHWHDADTRRDVSARQSKTTHGAPEAVDACVHYADLLAEAIAGRARADVMAPRAFAGAPKIEAIAGGAWRGKPRHEIRGTGYVVDALEAAIWCVGTSSDFRGAVTRAANLREDADTTAAIAGQLAGALYGASGIPAEWLERVAWRDRLETIARKLVVQPPGVDA
jgi:ADP-ribosyl-[dinitrogen reductase] hydrolase